MQAQDTTKLCECGCGQPTRIADRTWAKHGWVQGRPLRFINGHNTRSKRPEYEVQDQGYLTPCWVWQRHTNNNGYGVGCSASNVSALAHRVVYERHRGAIPDGAVIDHLCGVRRCVNPDHLEPVTQAENVRRGPRVRLNERQVRQIRLLCESGRWMRKEIAQAYGVDPRTVSEIVHRRSWRNVA